MRRLRPEQERYKVPVFKNVIYALRLVWKADKKLLLGYILQKVSQNVFSIFIQNILFLKILLEVITANTDFKIYVKYLVLFFAV